MISDDLLIQRSCAVWRPGSKWSAVWSSPTLGRSESVAEGTPQSLPSGVQLLSMMDLSFILLLLSSPGQNRPSWPAHSLSSCSGGCCWLRSRQQHNEEQRLPESEKLLSRALHTSVVMTIRENGRLKVHHERDRSVLSSLHVLILH